MAHYRRSDVDLSTRRELAMEMLRPIPERRWGRVTELARSLGVSRTFLYHLRDQAWQILTEGLAPGKPGPQAEEEALRIDKEAIDRAIVVQPMLKGTVRDIQQGLRLLMGVERSVGYISQTLRRAGEQAKLQNRGIRVAQPVLGEADEIFQGRKPCLTLVDGRSFLALNLTAAPCRDATAWGLTYLEQVERGIQFHDLACDGGTGLRAGVKEAGLAIPLRWDLFHLLRDARRLTRRLEAAAYKAITTAERARRADMEAQGLIRRRGPRLKIDVSLNQAEIDEEQAIYLFDCWCWLLSEARQVLEPITPSHAIVSVIHTEETLETAIALLNELDQPQITAFADDLARKMTELLSPLAWLEDHLAPQLAPLDTQTQAFLIWTWQQRHSLAIDIEADIPERLQPVAHAVWESLDLFHRSSSLAESLHSWLRPYLQIHRGMPDWLLPLLQIFWNHHVFERGKRAGSSPLELAGVEDAPSLGEVFHQLVSPGPACQPAPSP